MASWFMFCLYAFFDASFVFKSRGRNRENEGLFFFSFDNDTDFFFSLSRSPPCWFSSFRANSIHHLEGVSPSLPRRAIVACCRLGPTPPERGLDAAQVKKRLGWGNALLND